MCVSACRSSLPRQTAPLQRLWLAPLSRTETSPSICIAAPWPYWWAATSHDKYAMCQRTPPVGETGVSRDTCVEFPGPEHVTNLFVAPTLLSEFKMNDQDVLAFFCNGYVLALISANPPFIWRVPSALLFDWSIHLTSVKLFSQPISNSGSSGEVESIPADGAPWTGRQSQG